MKSDQYLKDKFQYFWQCILEPDTIGDGCFISDEFIPVQLDKIIEFLIDDLELLSDKLFEQEDIPVLIDVIQSVDVGSDGSSQLPSVGWLETL